MSSILTTVPKTVGGREEDRELDALHYTPKAYNIGGISFTIFTAGLLLPGIVFMIAAFLNPIYPYYPGFRNTALVFYFELLINFILFFVISAVSYTLRVIYAQRLSYWEKLTTSEKISNFLMSSLGLPIGVVFLQVTMQYSGCLNAIYHNGINALSTTAKSVGVTSFLKAALGLLEGNRMDAPDLHVLQQMSNNITSGSSYPLSKIPIKSVYHEEARSEGFLPIHVWDTPREWLRFMGVKVDDQASDVALLQAIQEVHQKSSKRPFHFLMKYIPLIICGLQSIILGFLVYVIVKFALKKNIKGSVSGLQQERTMYQKLMQTQMFTSNFGQYIQIAVLVGAIVFLTIASILVRDTAFVKHNPTGFAIENMTMFVATFLAFSIVRKLRTDASLLRCAIDGLVMGIGAVVLNVLSQFSGMYMYQFTREENVIALKRRNIHN
jgi:hypothetical protein